MPSPKKGEKKKDFLGRCMAHPHTQKWKSDQRYAICNSFWDEHLNEDVVEEKDMRGEIQSKSQRRLMGWAHACDKGLTDNCPSSIKDVAKGFKKKKDLKKMASHKEKDLPEKKVTESTVGDAIITKKLQPVVDKAIATLDKLADTTTQESSMKDLLKRWLNTLPNMDALDLVLKHPKFTRIASKWKERVGHNIEQLLKVAMKSDASLKGAKITESIKWSFKEFLLEALSAKHKDETHRSLTIKRYLPNLNLQKGERYVLVPSGEYGLLLVKQGDEKILDIPSKKLYDLIKNFLEVYGTSYTFVW